MAGKSSLEERVGLLEIAVEYLTGELRAKTDEMTQANWPRRNCDATGCGTILRAQQAADLPKHCAKHTEPAASA
jgi:hypothetical protein